MSSRALAYLLAIRLKNFVALVVRNPRRLVGALLLIAVFTMMIVAGSVGREAAGRPTGGAIWGLLSLYLLLAFFGGLGEPGLGFRPADLDYVLPGPFRRAQVLIYYLGRQYGQVFVLSFMYAAVLGAAGMPHPTLAWLGIFLCLVTAAHLQVLSTLSTGLVGDRLFARMRRVSRAILIGVLVLGAAVALAGIAKQADVPGLLWRLQESPAMQVVTNPAIQAVRLAKAADIGAAVPALGALLAWVAGTFAALLLFPVNFLETAYTAAQTRKKDSLGPVVKTFEKSLRVHDAPAFFRGAGAVAWLNLLTLKRRMRMIVGLVAMLVVILLVSGTSADADGSAGFPKVLFVLAFFPVIANLPLGFRGHVEHLEFLKTLPIGSRRLALAEVAVPAVVIWLVQAPVIVLFWGLGQLDGGWALGALLGLPVLDLGVTAVVELFQLGKARSELGFLTTTLQMLTIFLTLALAGAVGGAAMLLVPLPAVGVFFGVATYMVFDVLLILRLGRRFERYEKGSD